MRLFLQRGFAPIIILIVILTIGGGSIATVKLSESSVSGELLYKVKGAVEQIRLQIARTNEDKAKVYLDIANARLSEVEKLESRGASSEVITATLEAYNQTNKKALELLGQSDSSSQEVQDIVEEVKKTSKKQEEVVKKVLESAPEETKEKVEQVAQESKAESESFVQKTESSSTPSATSSPTIAPSVTSPMTSPTSTPISTTNPTVTPTSTTTPTVAPTATPTPTPAPTPIMSKVYIQAWQHIGNNDYTVANAKVKIVNANTSQVLHVGYTDQGGNSPKWDVAANMKIDVYLYPPGSPNTALCGSVWSVDTGPYGTWHGQNMRIYASDASPCIHE